MASGVTDRWFVLENFRFIGGDMGITSLAAEDGIEPDLGDSFNSLEKRKQRFQS